MTKEKYKKLINKHAYLRATYSKYEIHYIVLSFLAFGLAYDLQLELTQKLTSGLFMYLLGYTLARCVYEIVFLFQKRKYEKTEEFKQLEEEKKKEYKEEMEKED